MTILAIYSTDSTIKHTAINELKRHGFITYSTIYKTRDESQIRRNTYAMCEDYENVIIKPEQADFVPSNKKITHIRFINNEEPDFSNYIYGDSEDFEVEDILYYNEENAIKKLFERLEIIYKPHTFENKWTHTGIICGVFIIGCLLHYAFY